MVPWLIGIGVAGFFLSLLLTSFMRPEVPGKHLGRSTRIRWRAGAFFIALTGMALAAIFAWPAWLLGRFVSPCFGFAESVGGAIFACIFGLGGAALTGAFSIVLREDCEKAEAESRTRY